MVEAKGIGYYPEHSVTLVDATTRRIQFANGASTEFDLLAYVPPHRVPRVVAECGLTGDSGWVSVHRQTLETRFPGVYAIGDVTGIIISMGKPLPKAGVFAAWYALWFAGSALAEDMSVHLHLLDDGVEVGCHSQQVREGATSLEELLSELIECGLEGVPAVWR